MPGFRRVPREEASSRRPAATPGLARLKQYQGYIKKVPAGETGRLTPATDSGPIRTASFFRNPGLHLAETEVTPGIVSNC